MTHKTIVCLCGRVLSTCRCPATDKPKVVSSTPCTHLSKPEERRSRFPARIVFDWDKVRTPEVLTVDGEPFPFPITDELEPEVVTIFEGPNRVGYLVVGLLAEDVEIHGKKP